jgi:hypothetical protein
LEISNRKAMEWEALQEKHFVSKAKRVELYGEELSRLNEEAAKRDYSELPLEKLLELKIKFADRLKQEETEIRLKQKGTFDDTLANLDEVIVGWKA